MKCAIQDVIHWPGIFIRHNQDIQEVKYKDFITGPMKPGAYFITEYSDEDFDELEEAVGNCTNEGGLVLYFTTGGLNSLDSVLTKAMTMAEVKAFIADENPLFDIANKL